MTRKGAPLPSEKSERSSKRKQIRNRGIRSTTRTFIAKARNAIEAGDQELASNTVGQAIKSLDKAAKRGVIHSNNAARRKSRLAKKLNSISQ